MREKSRVEQMDTALVALDREIAKINLQNKEQIGQLN